MKEQTATSQDSPMTSPSSDRPSGPTGGGILERLDSGDGRHQSPAPKRRPPPLSELKERVDKEKHEDTSKPSTGVDEHGAGCKSTLAYTLNIHLYAVLPLFILQTWTRIFIFKA